MTPNQLKTGYFVLEGLNSFAVTYYFCYLFFFMHERFGYGNEHNLWLSALNGFVYMFAAWFGGRFAQRLGYFTALRLGFGVVALSLVAGSLVEHPGFYYLVVVVWTIGICFTWPSLEALVSEHEPPARLAKMVGLYNIVWSAASSLAYFAGGALLNLLGLRSLFWVPIGLHLCQWALVGWLKRQAATAGTASITPLSPHLIPLDPNLDLNLDLHPNPNPDLNPNPALARAPDPLLPPHPPRPLSLSPRSFLRLAWVANPFAYMAINTLLAMMPDLAGRFHLSLSWAGVFCSVWLVARMAAFGLLWWWPGWHYRFRWLATAYGLIVVSFLLMVLAPHLGLMLVGEVVFGLAIGLVYYSSLFYSMDVGETKGEHGGIHEAAIGFGIFAGPAVGASSLYLFPHVQRVGAWATGGLLLLGAILFLVVRALQPSLRQPRPPVPRAPSGSSSVRT